MIPPRGIANQGQAALGLARPQYLDVLHLAQQLLRLGLVAAMPRRLWRATAPRRGLERRWRAERRPLRVLAQRQLPLHERQQHTHERQMKTRERLRNCAQGLQLLRSRKAFPTPSEKNALRLITETYWACGKKKSRLQELYLNLLLLPQPLHRVAEQLQERSLVWAILTSSVARSRNVTRAVSEDRQTQRPRRGTTRRRKTRYFRGRRGF